MKLLYIFIIAITVINPNASAENLQTQSSEITILISQIKSAQSSDRRTLMNQLKIELRQMNKESKAEVIKELRESLNNPKMQQHSSFKQSESSKHNRGTNMQRDTLHKKGKR